MEFIRPYKVHPHRAWTLEETKIPAQRAWTVEETKIPHRPNSANRPPKPRRDFRGAVVRNPSFKRYNEPVESVDEEDLEAQLMEPPQVAHGPHRVAIKRENINVVRECEWDVKSLKGDNFKEKTSISGKLVFLLAAVFFTSIVSLVLTLLILFGSVGTRNCSCGDNQAVAGTSATKSTDDDSLVRFSENITTLDKRLEGRILELEQRNEETKQMFLDEIERLKTQLEQQQENQILNLTGSLESTRSELNTLRVQLATQMVDVWAAANSTAAQLNRLKKVWIAVNKTAEKTSNLTDKIDQEFKNVKKNVNETKENLNKLTSSLRDFNLTVTHRSESLETRIKSEEQKSNHTQKFLEKHSRNLQDLEILLNATRQDAKKASWQQLTALWSAGNLTKREFHRVWTTLNTSQVVLLDKLTEVKDNFTDQVTHHSKSLETRIKSEEQKSNNTQKVLEKHSKNLQDLEILLNATRQDAKKASWQQLTALWSAGNLTKREFHRVWTTLNTSQVVLSDKLIEVKDNLTDQLNLTAVLLQSADASLLASLVEVNTTITEKVNNVSKMAGPIGPKGFNGSQGPVGRNGSIGPPGPKGSGDFSKCEYKLVTEKQTPGASTTTAGLAEPNGKRVLGVSCSTNYAAEYNLFSIVHDNVRRFSCICKGPSNWFKPYGDPSYCYIHYWECPLTT